MSQKARILKRLYDEGRISDDGILRAVADGVITAEEYELITGVPYEPPTGEDATTADFIDSLNRLGVNV